MDKWYLLLYLPLVGFTILWLLAGVKVVKDWRKHSHENLHSLIGAEIGLALFLIGFAIMVTTHGRGYKIAMLFVIAMALVNLLRSRAFFTPKTDAEIYRQSSR